MISTAIGANKWAEKSAAKGCRIKKGHSVAVVDENVKIDLQREIQDFLVSQEMVKEMPASLTKAQRAYIHQYIRHLGLTSRSTGTGDKRRLRIFKLAKITAIKTNIQCFLSNENRILISQQLRKLEFPPKLKTNCHSPQKTVQCTGRFHSSLAVKNLTRKLIPPSNFASKHIRMERMKLPIFEYREDLLRAIQLNQVIIVNGSTGSGKSTQVPQYIMEHANACRMPCRIVCTQPRRLAATSIAERVSFERSEKVGTTVGYQIRLENKFQPNTNLIFATSGCFIRSLMSDASETFSGLTHLIIDEIHERDRNTDFLLISIRDHLPSNSNLKVILMSATMNINLLCNYFGGCRVIEVPGHCYETRTFFLEDILFYLKYETDEMRELLNTIPEEKCAAGFNASTLELNVETQKFVDDLIESCRDEREDVMAEYFEQLIYLIEGEGVSVDVRHSESGCTPLIVCAMRNNLMYLHRLLKKGAKIEIADISGKTAMDYAKEHEEPRCVERLGLTTVTGDDNINDNRKRLLLAYQRQFNSDYDDIDNDLLLSLLLTITKADSRGSILVFLPGYNEMMMLKEMIESEFRPGSYKLFLIHGSMSTHDQRMAFKSSRVRKMILATNIAETSITFPDVTHVVDTGRVKENVYYAVTGSSYMKSVDISRACAHQRAGRVGRTQTGICYRLYSSAKFAAMSEYTIPELLRIPLTEICLYAKALSRKDSIASYLSKAIEPPPKVSILNAVEKLIMLEALNKDEKMTILGKRLVGMPLDVQLGKCLLYAILLRCLDPVLTIVAYYSVKDPFLLTTDRSERGRVNKIRRELCENVSSDHLGIIRLFQKWFQSRQLKTEERFLADNNLSKASLEMMSAVQRQIVSHLTRTILPQGIPYSSFNSNASDWNMIRACLTAGLYPNVAHVDRGSGKISTQYDKSINFHPSSVLRDPTARTKKKISLKNLPTDWLIFNEKSRVGTRALIRYNTVVTAFTIALFCGTLTPFQVNFEPQREIGDEDLSSDVEADDDRENQEIRENHTLTEIMLFPVDDWISFGITKSEHFLAVQLKQWLSTIFVNFLYSGRHWHPEQHSVFINALRKILAADSREQFGAVIQPFDDSYLPRRYDTMVNIQHFEVKNK